MFHFCILTILTLGNLVSGQDTTNFDGTCPEYCEPVELNITSDMLTGVWFLQYFIPYYYEVNAKCMYLNNTEIGENQLNFERPFRDTDTNEPTSIFGETDFESDGSIMYKLIELGLPIESQYVVVTPELIVEIACHECGFYEKKGSGFYAKIYTRLPFPSCDLLDYAIDTLVNCGISRESLILHDQHDCKQCFDNN